MKKLEVDNAVEMGDALAELGRKAERKIVNTGLRAGGKVWQSAARGEAPSRTGKVKRSIKVRAGKRKKGSLSINVGMGAKDYTGEAFYGSFIEYGYRIGKRSLGDARKLVPANPFMQRAFDQSHEAASDACIEVWKSGLDAAIKEGNK